MASIDFDRSGISFQSYDVDLGPSLGRVWINGAIISVTEPGAIVLPLGVTLVKVSVPTGGISFTLPHAKGVLAIPASFAIVPVTIFDLGGFADSNPITINAAEGETIGGLASVTIAIKRGMAVLTPNAEQGSWTASS
jgi:hypothetical protein